MPISGGRKGTKRVQRSPEAEARRKAKRKKADEKTKAAVSKTVKKFYGNS